VYTLITGATTAEAHRLKIKLNDADIILGDYQELPAFMLKQANMISLPNPKSIAYAHKMLTLCLDKQIDIVYILREEEALLLTEAGQLFTEYGIRIEKPIVDGP